MRNIKSLRIIIYRPTRILLQLIILLITLDKYKL